METSVLNLFSPFGLWAVSAESAPPLFFAFPHFFLFLVGRPENIPAPLFCHKLMTHFVPRRETNNTTTTKREKEEVITARVSFPSVPLERKWWCEYSSLSLYENARFFREIYFFSSFSHPQKREFLEKEEERKEEEREEGEEQFFLERKRHEKKHKKEKKTAHKLCSHSRNVYKKTDERRHGTRKRC